MSNNQKISNSFNQIFINDTLYNNIKNSLKRGNVIEICQVFSFMIKIFLTIRVSDDNLNSENEIGKAKLISFSDLSIVREINVDTSEFYVCKAKFCYNVADLSQGRKLYFCPNHFFINSEIYELYKQYKSFDKCSQKTQSLVKNEWNKYIFPKLKKQLFDLDSYDNILFYFLSRQMKDPNHNFNLIKEILINDPEFCNNLPEYFLRKFHGDLIKTVDEGHLYWLENNSFNLYDHKKLKSFNGWNEAKILCAKWFQCKSEFNNNANEFIKSFLNNKRERTFNDSDDEEYNNLIQLSWFDKESKDFRFIQEKPKQEVKSYINEWLEDYHPNIEFHKNSSPTLKIEDFSDWDRPRKPKDWDSYSHDSLSWKYDFEDENSEEEDL
jgi:hypothetical protein